MGWDNGPSWDDEGKKGRAGPEQAGTVAVATVRESRSLFFDAMQSCCGSLRICTVSTHTCTSASQLPTMETFGRLETVQDDRNEDETPRNHCCRVGGRWLSCPSDGPCLAAWTCLYLQSCRVGISPPDNQQRPPLSTPKHPNTTRVGGEGPKTCSVGPRDWGTSHKTIAVFTTRACAACLFSSLSERANFWIKSLVFCPPLPRWFNSTGEVEGLAGAATDRAGSRSIPILRSAAGLWRGTLATPRDGGVPVSPQFPLPRCAARGLQRRDRRCRQGLAREIRSLDGGFEGVGEGQNLQFPSIFFPLPAQPLAASTPNTGQQ